MHLTKQCSEISSATSSCYQHRAFIFFSIAHKESDENFYASQLKSKLVETRNDGVIVLLRYQKRRNYTCLRFVTSWRWSFPRSLNENHGKSCDQLITFSVELRIPTDEASRWLRRKRKRHFYVVLEWWNWIVKYTRKELASMNQCEKRLTKQWGESWRWSERTRQLVSLERWPSLFIRCFWMFFPLALACSLLLRCRELTKKTPNARIVRIKFSLISVDAFHSTFESRLARSSNRKEK